MKRLFRAAVLLAAPFLVFLVGFELRFAQLRPSHIEAKKVLLERQAALIDVLVLGSSHEATGINPSELGRPAFNLSGQSQSLRYDLALLNQFRQSLSALKLVVIPLSYFSLEYELEQGPERWRAYHYKYFCSIPHQDWHKNVSLRNYSAYFLSSEAFRAKVLLGTAPDAMREFDPWGGWTNRPCSAKTLPPVPAEELARAATGTLKLHHSMMHPANLEVNLARLRRTIRELQHDQVQILLLTSPVTHYYREGMHADAVARMQAAIHLLVTESGVPYRDYAADARFTDTDFLDGDHLNCEGARKFTAVLREEALPGILGQRR